MARARETEKRARARVIRDYTAKEARQLSISIDDIITLIGDATAENWVLAQAADGTQGCIPAGCLNFYVLCGATEWHFGDEPYFAADTDFLPGGRARSTDEIIAFVGEDVREFYVRQIRAGYTAEQWDFFMNKDPYFDLEGLIKMQRGCINHGAHRDHPEVLRRLDEYTKKERAAILKQEEEKERKRAEKDVNDNGIKYEMKYKQDGTVDKRCKAYKLKRNGKRGDRKKQKVGKTAKNASDKTCKRNVSEAMKRFVAAEQEWRCKHCSRILQASFEIDHIIALCNGGTNDRDNLHALCRNCHGAKTIKERLFGV